MLNKLTTLTALCLLSILFVSTGLTKNKPIPEFKDVRIETQRYIDYYYSIKLSPSEQKILEKALKPLPAPCCSDNSALTC